MKYIIKREQNLDIALRALCEQIGQMLLVDDAISVGLEKYKETRSTAQNRLYWKWLAEFGNHLGYDKDDMHEALAEKFLEPEHYMDLDGNIKRKNKSTTKLKVDEFTEYLECIDRLAAQSGCRLSRPEDLYYKAMGYA